MLHVKSWLIAPVTALSLMTLGCANTSTLGSADRQQDGGHFTGHYVYFADSATFTLCDTGQRLPIADSPSALIMERAYLASRLEPMAPLPMSLTGKIERRVGMEESQGKIPHLVVESVNEVGKPLDCAVQTPLVGTAWEWLPQADEQDSAARLPHITLDDNRRVTGYTGCNNLNGRFEQQGEQLRFKGVATTRMACTSSNQSRIDSRLNEALSRSTHYDIRNGVLTLKDANQQVLARFKANHAQ